MRRSDRPPAKSSRPTSTAGMMLEPVTGSVGCELTGAGVAVVVGAVVPPEALWPLVLGPELPAGGPEDGGLAAPSTTNVPCMKGWIWQVWVNVPCFVNV